MLTERTAQELASTGRLADASTERSLHEVVTIATRSVPGCAAAAIVVWDAWNVWNESRVRATAASHPDVGKLLERQRHWAEGPTLDALHNLRPVFVSDTLEERRWTRYAAAAIRYGIRSTLVLPLRVKPAIVTVALHGARPHAWDERTVLPVTSLLAAQAGVVLRNVNEYDDAARATAQLRLALSRRFRVGAHHYP